MNLYEVKEGQIYVGGMPVQGQHWKEGNPPASLFVIRVKNGEYWEFVCGLDLIHDKNLFWLGGPQWSINGQIISTPRAFYDDFDKIKFILNNYCADTKGREWAIFEEEPLISSDTSWGTDY